MVIVMKPNATQQQIDNISEYLKKLGLGVHISMGAEYTIIGIIGDKRLLGDTPIELMPGVEKTIPIAETYKLVTKTFKPEPTVIEVRGHKIGGGSLTVIAGPCAVESEEQTMATAMAVKNAGAHMLRGGAYKPRTSPYSFQGLEEEGLKILAEARDATGLPIVSEVISPATLEISLKYLDVIQIGARNMQNFQLLREAGQARIPVILKRGISATIEEWLNAAEYIMSEGNYHVILCERGIRTFETSTRNTLDISAVPVLKEKTHLPVIVDPSHGTGKRDLVIPMSLAAIAAGADGLIVEVHRDPLHALSDGPQSLAPNDFADLMKRVTTLHNAMEHVNG
ncbi:3-deoxy-7-phosphoheptulonate synthase [Mahella sp.]|uniref:3-deoxy-7-phosphoheptulonate synthase n=1 Tax=Mahella sp. TaxID=2798721 RepID=UPI0025C724A3|nr:3-deoxy-7-phosphoheptulonate synthase [Mahella sp.]MBZ4666202.1 3-deoxy-D-arabinoheptulosonate-7-phosphate synthase [Mahella sp.]